MYIEIPTGKYPVITQKIIIIFMIKIIRFFVYLTTWLKDNMRNFNIDGYKFINNNRAGKTGGGVAMYINEDISFEQVDIHNDASDFEYMDNTQV